MELALKPCPFCGGDPSALTSDDGFTSIGCINPKCQDNSLLRAGIYVQALSPTEAALIWNSRPERACRIELVGGQGNQNWECSECGVGFDWDDMNDPPPFAYCPACGAKVGE